mgnify:CR=1 FL=1
MVTLTMWPSRLSRSAYLSSMVWGSLWLENLLTVSVNSWTGLTSISGSRRTNNRGKGRLRLSLRRGRISGQIDTTITDKGEILLDNRGQSLLKWLVRCSKNQYTRSWRKLRTSHSLNGQIRWEVTPWSAIKAFIANATRTEGTPQKTVELWRVIWSN